MKKTGLADSPFFSPPPPSQEVPPPAVVQTPQPIFSRSDAQTHERTPEHPHERTPAQMHEGTDEPLHKRTDAQTRVRSDAQTHERTPESSARTISRYSYDLYDDQADAIEALRLRWHKERGRHLTKGQVMRELLEKVLETHE